MNNEFDDSIGKVFRLYRVEKGKALETILTLHRITKEERQGKEKLGIANGMDLGHCVYLGNKYGGKFKKKAKFYYINNGDEDSDLKRYKEKQPGGISVTFYGD
ncbi:hypothetical protein ACFLZZ_02250 [Nanoarchaeota archaeon]